MAKPVERLRRDAAPLILGWTVSGSKSTRLVSTVVQQALAARCRANACFTATGIFHLRDAGSQCRSLAFTAELREAGILGSIGTVGDALDNALMECGIQRKCRKAAPRKSRSDTQSGNDTRPSATLQIQPSMPLRDPVGPELPADREWPRQTIEWWDVWRRSEQRSLYMQSDWLFPLDTALIHAAIWTLDPEVLSTRMGLFGELRLRLSKFGATVGDRMRMRMRMRVTSSAVPMTAQVETPLGGAGRR